MSYETDLHEKDGAWKADAKIAAGVDDVDNTHPLNCTTDGTLEVAIDSSVPIDVLVGNVVPVSQSGVWTVNLAVEPTIDIGKVDQGVAGVSPWPVTVTNFPGSGTPVNVFGQITAPYDTETVIVTYTVPTAKTLAIAHIIGWGDYDGEFFVRVDGTQVGGGRNSTADRTLILPYNGTVLATAGQVVTVSIIMYSTHTETFKANILGGLS
jgi:hypothetical protein